ncbi:putative short-chain dehydrogenase reductase sdr protein [Hirsutella rhossiliensis]|uniref:Short-chain dehydrogenase reductase sdr protein n=1 Tax=Hirsutella rhossiliensis TaxID=111463 RepID=A0A9P8MVS6_9HYPO|nr:putative short-chain dehydrogenase reductase sdr protein [Hirsutella rhossiliensis]KAH0963113.1 putative short-chain dehydrogenase reductase sdr protein [Hirsutella rhossiliensis]
MAGLEVTGVETWTYFAISLVVILVRVGLRWRAEGFRGLDADDYLMVLAAPLYGAGTVVAFFVNVHAHGLANNGPTPEERAALDPDSLEWRLRVKGSQLHLSGWLLYTALLWTLKLCWLFFYKRLGDRVNRMTLKVNLGFVLVGSTYVAVFATILFGCWPISKHWQINPDPGNRCYPAIAELQAWVVVCTNLTTDLYIMTIPLPMVWRARISARKKAGLGAMFCCGLITIGFGAARCAFILRNDSGDTEFAARWSSRESFVAVIISNVPILFPLIRQESRSGAGVYKLSAMSSHKQSGQGKSRNAMGHANGYGGHESEESIVSVHQPGRTDGTNDAQHSTKMI